MLQIYYLTVICFILYLLFFCWLITKISFFTNSGLSIKWLLGLFLLKIIAGLIYAWFYSRLPSVQDDTWNFFKFSTNETDWLLHDPLAFIKDLFSYGYTKPGNLFSGENSYWNDLKTAMVIKLLAVFNVLTGKNYYADLIFFNFLFFFGPVAFFRAIMSYYPHKKWLLVWSVFLLPSFLFWCSGIHKDGFIFSAIGIIIYLFNVQLKRKKIILKYCFIILACSVLLFALRNFLLFFLVLALFAWFVSSKYPSRKWVVFGSIYSAGILVFFALPLFSSSLDLPQYIINKQSEFKEIPGNSIIIVPPLTPSVESFIHFLPSAIDIAFLRPHLNEAKSLSYLFAALENLFLIVLIVGCFLFRDKKSKIVTINLFCIFFSLSILILSGYTVTFSGSVVRYKSIVLPLLITAFIVLFDEKKLLNILRIKSSSIPSVI